MGARLDNLYPKVEKLDYKDIDIIVHRYKETESQQERQSCRGILLKQFHHYFMKYVSLLKGTIGSLRYDDTRAFLALFASKSFSNPQHIQYFLIKTCKQLEEEDIYNELVALFLGLLERFEFREGVSFSAYIIKYMRWSIKDWIIHVARNPLTSGSSIGPYSDRNYSDDTILEYLLNCNEIAMGKAFSQEQHHGAFELPSLDLAWVFDNTSPLFGTLTVYERFLLYLNFKEGLGVRQIGERLGRAKDTVHIHIQQALTKLRNAYLKEEE